MPSGLNLTQAKLTPLRSVNISQKLVASLWSFDLNTTAKKKLTQNEWQVAIDSLFKSDQLIWEDIDKKGRPRKRNFRGELCSLKIKLQRNFEAKLPILKSIRLELNALIGPGGRSIKPIQIKHWLEEFLGEPLEINHVQRDEIQLLKC